VLLWGVGLLFVFSFVAGPAALFMTGADRMRERKRATGAGYFAGGVLAGLTWLSAAGYCVYRAWRAIP
jgi:hypothetical protein